MSKSTSPVEPSGSKRLSIGRRRSRRLPDLTGDRVPDRLGGFDLRLGDRHQVAEADSRSATRHASLEPVLADLRPAAGTARAACRRHGVEVACRGCARRARTRPPAVGTASGRRSSRSPVADDTADLDPARHRVRADLEDRASSSRSKPDRLVGQLDAVAVELRERDSQVLAALERRDLDHRLAAAAGP